MISVSNPTRQAKRRSTLHTAARINKLNDANDNRHQSSLSLAIIQYYE
jgi:hypothetical protein